MSTTTTVPTLCLDNGVEIPILGFGENEAEVGRAIRASGIPREELFITTKLWIQDAGEERAHRAFDVSLERLGLDYLDLYLIHQPFGDYYGSWRAMEKLHREDRVRAIGVSNFHTDRLVDLIDHNEIAPAVNQIETHPLFQRAADQQLMRDRGVQIESWGPLAQAHEDVFSDPGLAKIGEDHGKSIAQVVLRWLIQRDVVVIPKSVRAERMAENLDVFDFNLTADEMARIATLDRGQSPFIDHRDPETVGWLGNVRF
jgi:2,5-diketo-D-gluconate reductase A